MLCYVMLCYVMLWYVLLYCIVSIHLYSASPSAHQSEALPVRETQKGAVHKVRHAIFGQFYPPPPCHTSSHIPGPPPESTSHISDPPIFRRPSTKIPDKSPLVQILSQLFAGFLSGGFCQGVFCLEGFVRGGFCPFPFCQNTSVTSES